MGVLNGTVDRVNETTNGTNLIENLLLLSEVTTPLYLALILLPSLYLNGFVIRLFVKEKDFRSPLNLLIVNQCCAGIVSNFVNGLLILIISPLALKYGICDTGPPLLASALWTHYGMNALNLAAISVGIYVTLKYGASVITYKRIMLVIVINWIYPAIWAVVLSSIVKDYPSLTCTAYTDFEPPPDILQPQVYQLIPFVTRDLMIDMVTRVLVAVFCIASYRLFRRNTINPPPGLTRKMLLLPILMTLLLTAITLGTGVLLIGFNNGYGVTISAESPIVIIKDVAQILVEYDAIVYATLLIYLNTKINQAFRKFHKDLFNHCHCNLMSKQNKISQAPRQQNTHLNVNYSAWANQTKSTVS